MPLILDSSATAHISRSHQLSCQNKKIITTWDKYEVELGGPKGKGKGSQKEYYWSWRKPSFLARLLKYLFLVKYVDPVKYVGLVKYMDLDLWELMIWNINENKFRLH